MDASLNEWSETIRWGEERIANELWLKLGFNVSPRTIKAYWPTEDQTRRPRLASQSWQTFVRNRAQCLLACDFMVALTVQFRIVYVFVVMEIGRRRVLLCDATAPSDIRVDDPAATEGSRAITAISSSFMIAMRPSPPSWTRPSRRSRCEPSELLCDLQRRMRSASE